MAWLSTRRTQPAEPKQNSKSTDAQHVPSQACDIVSENQARAFSAPAKPYRSDKDISAEAVRLRQFLRDVLLADYGLLACLGSKYPHEEYYHYAAVIYDRHNLARAPRSNRESLASRAMNLSRSSSHLILARHVYGPASELGIGEELMDTTLIRYLHFADPVERTYTSSIPGSSTEKVSSDYKQTSSPTTHKFQGSEALRTKIVWDRSEIVPAVFEEQMVRHQFELATNSLVTQHFPSGHLLRQRIEAEAKTLEKDPVPAEQQKDHETQQQATSDTRIDTPEYVRWLAWFSRTST